MGMDWLDITFRLEKSFGIKIRKGDLERLVTLPISSTKIGIRCCDLHEMVLKLCEEQGVQIPPSHWTRVKFCIMRGCRAKAKTVRKESWLHDDCGCT